MPSAPRSSLITGDNEMAEALVGRSVRKDFGHHGVFGGIVSGIKAISGIDKLFFKIK